jgi:cell shape-determining protein MreC
MPQPILTNYEKEAFKIRQLQEENETLKQKLATFIEYKQQQQRFNNTQMNPHVPPDIIDDFYVIAA